MAKNKQDTLRHIFETLGRGRRKSDRRDISTLTDKQIRAFSFLMAANDNKKVRKTYELLLNEIRKAQRAANKAITDSYLQQLSQLPNKDSFMNILKALTRRAALGQGFAVVMLDIDQFKKFNDTHGHGLGDKVIQMVAERLRKVSRTDGDFVSHWGGDEFAVIIGDVSLEEAELVIQKIQKAFPITIEIDGVDVPINVSVGGIATSGIENTWDELPDNGKKPSKAEISFVLDFLKFRTPSKGDTEKAAKIIFNLADACMYNMKGRRKLELDKTPVESILEEPRPSKA